MSDELVAGRYRLEDQLGSGASATVYRARDTILERNVALKALSPLLAGDSHFLERFQREARLAARLDHPNIVTIYDVGTMPDGRAFITMRLIEGRSLDAVLGEPGPMPARRALDLVAQIGSALDYIHGQGLVHRDVKPSNIMIDGQGRAILADFGIALALDAARVTLPGVALGTPRYMAPEQIRGLDPTASTDVYALGVVAYELLTGQPPFKGSGSALLYRIVNEDPPPAHLVFDGLPPDVAGVLQRSMAKEARDRWPTAGAFTGALSAAFARTSQPAPLPPPPVVPPPPSSPPARAFEPTIMAPPQPEAPTLAPPPPPPPRVAQPPPAAAPETPPTRRVSVPPARPPIAPGPPPRRPPRSGRPGWVLPVVAGGAGGVVVIAGALLLLRDSGGGNGATADSTPGSPVASAAPRTSPSPRTSPGPTAGPTLQPTVTPPPNSAAQLRSGARGRAVTSGCTLRLTAEPTLSGETRTIEPVCNGDTVIVATNTPASGTLVVTEGVVFWRVLVEKTRSVGWLPEVTVDGSIRYLDLVR